MAIIESSTGTSLAVDPTFGAGRVSLRPVDVLGWYSVAPVSGAATTLAANGCVFSLRNISANLLMVRRVSIGYVNTTAFTTAQALGFGLYVARAFTASDTAGTAVAVTGSQNKHRTSLATPTSLDCRIATAAVVTAGTRTLDTVARGLVSGSVSATVGSSVPMTPLLSHDAGDYPLILAQNEGIVINNLIVMGAAGVGNIYVVCEFAELAAY